MRLYYIKYLTTHIADSRLRGNDQTCNFLLYKSGLNITYFSHYCESRNPSREQACLFPTPWIPHQVRDDEWMSGNENFNLL